MAKKNYQRLENEFEPSVSWGERQVTLNFRTLNSKGTKVDVAIKVEKYWLPNLVKEFARIAKADAAGANAFVERIKAAAE